MERLLIVLFLAIFTTNAFCAEPVLGADSYLIEADEMFFKDNSSYEARGNVRIKFRESTLYADHAVYDATNGFVQAKGDIIILDDTQGFRANSIHYDLKSETGWLDNISGLFNNTYYICARHMNRKDKDNYEFFDARLTTCTGILPDWSFTFGHADAEINGYVVGEHATGNIKDFPYLYTPKFLFPLKIDRQTGFLVPGGGYDSEKGVYFSEQFFWAMSVDKDITLGVTGFSERGALGAAEFRYVVSPYSNIYLSAEGISDTYSPVEKAERARYTSQSNIVLPLGFEFIANADYVTDYMYMRDFYSFNIYDKRLKNEENAFLQDISLRNTNKYVKFHVSFVDNLKYTDTTRGYLKTNITSEPQIFLQNNYRNVGGIFNVVIFSQFDKVKYTEKDHDFQDLSESVASLNYTRWHNDVSLYRTFKLPMLLLTPKAQIYYTRWDDLEHTATPSKLNDITVLKTPDNKSVERAIPRFVIRANLNEIYRDYDVRHGILNTLTYEYVEKLEQSGLPEHLNGDRIAKANDLTWTIKSYYNPINWTTNISLSQTVTFNAEDNRSMLPLSAKLFFQRHNVFYNNLEIKRSHYKNDTTDAKSGYMDYVYEYLNITLGKDSFIAGRYVFNKELTENNTEAGLEVGTKLSDFLFKMGMSWLGQDKFLYFKHLSPTLYRASVVWQSQCVSLGTIFETEKYTQINAHTRTAEVQRDYRVGIYLSLNGLGDMDAWVYSDRIAKTEY